MDNILAHNRHICNDLTRDAPVQALAHVLYFGQFRHAQ